MADAARAVAAGDYQSHLPRSGPAEVQTLATAFNEMVGRVQTTSQAQRDFVANVSHDLRTPLTSIQGFAQAIVDGTAGDAPSQRHAAQVIYDESDRLRRLVESLLDLARLDAGQMVFSMGIVDLTAILRGVMERLSLKANEKGIRFEDRLVETPALLGDGDRLAQVFTNLLDNAIQHSPSGGVVTVRGKVEPGWALVDVEDTGTGIPPDELSRIFERFYRLDKARPGGEGRGLGLGLAISREIVQAHGGTLTAQSMVGRGSCFAVRLPLARSDTIATLLPGATFHLGRHDYAPARALVDGGAAIALATDFNPGTSPTLNMQMILSLACAEMRLSPAEAIAAATVNAAYAVARGHRLGRLEPGLDADIAVFDVEDYREIPYYFGMNHCWMTIKRGNIAWHR
jgi:signal transduction histidine kinase